MADDKFVERYPGLGAVAGKRIPLPHRTVAEAKQKIDALVHEFDSQAVHARILRETDLQD